VESVDLGETPAEEAPRREIISEDRALKAAEAEIRRLKSELRTRETELAEEKSSVQELNASVVAIRAEVDLEKASLQEAARVEAAQQKKEGFDRGHEEGLAKGYSDGLVKSEAEVRADYENRFSQALKLLADMNKSLQDARGKLALAHAPQLIRLWEAMMHRMLQVEVEMDHDVVRRVLEGILARVSDRERIIVYLNGADVEMIDSGKDRLLDSIRGVKSFEILSDEHVDRGSCLVETNMGIYDARWRTQIEQVSSEVEAILMESMMSHGSGNGGA
jgi:flagellar assembly protein FliH